MTDGSDIARGAGNGLSCGKSVARVSPSSQSSSNLEDWQVNAMESELSRASSQLYKEVVDKHNQKPLHVKKDSELRKSVGDLREVTALWDLLTGHMTMTELQHFLAQES